MLAGKLYALPLLSVIFTTAEPPARFQGRPLRNPLLWKVSMLPTHIGTVPVVVNAVFVVSPYHGKRITSRGICLKTIISTISCSKQR